MFEKDEQWFANAHAHNCRNNTEPLTNGLILSVSFITLQRSQATEPLTARVTHTQIMPDIETSSLLIMSKTFFLKLKKKKSYKTTNFELECTLQTLEGSSHKSVTQIFCSVKKLYE